MLPNITLQFLDSQGDGYGALSAAAATANDYTQTAAIGEVYPDATGAMSIAFQYGGLLECVPITTSTTLSNKQDYPNIYRTGASAAYVANAMVDFVSFLSVENIGILVSDSNYGQNFATLLTNRAQQHGIKFLFVTYSSADRDYGQALSSLKNHGAQVILTEGSQFDIQALLLNARDLEMLNSNYSFVLNNEYNHDIVLATNFDKGLSNDPPNLDGVFQVTTSIPSDRPFVKELEKEWESLVSNTVKADRTCSVAAAGLKISPGTVGCFANSEVWCGVVPKVKRLLNRVPALVASVYDSVECLDTLVHIFDYNIKANVTSLDSLVDRSGTEKSKATLMDFYGKISYLVNNASADFDFARGLSVDKFGDPVKVIDIVNYQFNATFNTSLPVKVGTWSNGTIALQSGLYYFTGGLTSPPQTPPIIIPVNMSIRLGFVIFVAACSLLTISLLIYMYLHIQFRIIQASSPTFLCLVVVGANFSYIGTFIAIVTPTVFTCSAYQWFKYLGFAIVFGSLLIKTYRIEIIFNSKGRKVSAIKDIYLLIRLLAYIAFWILLLAIYVGVSDLRPTVYRLKEVNTDTFFIQFRISQTCDYGYFNYGLMGLVLLTLLYGCVLTYLVRDTPSAFNESKWIGLSIYNWTFVGIIVQTIILKAIQDPDMIYAAEAIMTVITQTGVVALMFIPKVLGILSGNGNVLTTGFKTESHDSHNESAERLPKSNGTLSAKKVEEPRLPSVVVKSFKKESFLSAPASPKANWTLE